MNIERLNAPRCAVGEGPIWDAAEQALFYIDIIGKRVMRWDPVTGQNRQWDTPAVIGSMALRASGGALLALADGFYALDFDTGAVSSFAKPDPLPHRAQLNDGKADRRGRFIAGSTDSKMQDYIGAIFSLSPGGGVRALDTGICISNGPCWSPDDRVFYFADSIPKNIYAYDYDIETGAAQNRRVLVNTDALGGFPDGATVDAEGLIWSAICEGGKIAAFRPDGKIERLIDMPVKLPSSVMFGGPNLDILYVTSIDPRFLGRMPAPDDGCLFAIHGLGARGIAEPRFAG